MKKFVKILAGAAALSAAAFGAVSYGLLQYAFRRRETLDISQIDEKHEMFPYREEIVRGFTWLDGTPHEQVALTSHDGLNLVGQVYDPGNAKGTILGFHGYRSRWNNDFCGGTPFYYRSGYRVVLVDQRSHNASEGEYISMGIKEREDVVTWANWIGETYGKEAPLFITGVSMGAATVMMAADKDFEANVCGLIVDCGFTTAWEICEKCLKDWFHLPAFPFLYGANELSKKMLGFGLKDVDTRDVLSRSKYPVFFIHGTEDDFVPRWMTEENYEACTSEKQVFYVEGAKHAASYLVDMPAYQKMLTEFLGKYSKEIGKE